jgi:hypothetical protein
MQDVAEADVHGFLQPASAEEYWTYCTEVLTPVVAGLAAADGAARDRIQATVLGKLRRFEHHGQLRLPLHAPVHHRHQMTEHHAITPVPSASQRRSTRGV